MLRNHGAGNEERRQDVCRGVNQEHRLHAKQVHEDAADAGTRHADGRPSDRPQGIRSAERFDGHHIRCRRCPRRLERRSDCHLQNGKRIDPEERTLGINEQEAANHHRASEVRDDHQATAIEPVHEQAGERGREHAWQQFGDEHDAQRSRGISDRTNQGEDRERIQPVSEERGDVSKPQAAEVRVRTQEFDVAHAPLHGSRIPVRRKRRP